MKILMVDDDKTTRKLMTIMLRGKGFEVVQAENGLDAIEKLGAESVQFILTDLNMPFMDGIEFTRTVKSDPARSHLPVVMITTEADEEEKKKAMAAGADGYLCKPVTAEDVVHKIRTILADMLSRGGGSGAAV